MSATSHNWLQSFSKIVEMQIYETCQAAYESSAALFLFLIRRSLRCLWIKERTSIPTIEIGSAIFIRFASLTEAIFFYVRLYVCEQPHENQMPILSIRVPL